MIKLFIIIILGLLLIGSSGAIVFCVREIGRVCENLLSEYKLNCLKKDE